MTADGVRDRLAAAVGPGRVVTDPEVRAPHEVDWTGRYRGTALAVVRPVTTAQAAEVVRVCASAGVPVVTQGGNTGLVGGSVPDDTGRAVVLSTALLDHLGPVDPTSRQVTVGAGVTLGRLQAHARPGGLDLGVDLAARDTATLGGMVATNAGGVRVLRHGTMRRHLAGFEAVLADGTVLSRLGGLDKDNTGYDLGGLLCGSEGTLGVLTRLRLRLVPVLPYRVTALLGWADLAAMVAGLVELRTALPDLDAAEYMTAAGVELVRSRLGLANPLGAGHPAYLLIEVGATTDNTGNVADAVGGLRGLLGVAVAVGHDQRRALWALRDHHTEAVATLGPPRKYDVSVPPALVPDLVDAAVRVAQQHGLECYHWGHLGDGNVHLNVVGQVAGPVDEAALDGAILGLVAAHGGSISAEHGIGRLKRPWLHLSRSPAEVAAMVAVKAALDPRGLLNPGVLLP